MKHIDYTDKDGIGRNAYIVGGKRQEEMIARGWWLEVEDYCNESAQDMYNRLASRFKTVRIYKATTRIRGWYNYFAMCKR